MRIAGLAEAALPSLLTQLGHAIREWLEGKRRKDLKERVDKLEERVAALEGKGT